MKNIKLKMMAKAALQKQPKFPIDYMLNIIPLFYKFKTDNNILLDEFKKRLDAITGGNTFLEKIILNTRYGLRSEPIIINSFSIYDVEYCDKILLKYNNEIFATILNSGTCFSPFKDFSKLLDKEVLMISLYTFHTVVQEFRDDILDSTMTYKENDEEINISHRKELKRKLKTHKNSITCIIEVSESIKAYLETLSIIGD